ncbi:MMPL family transporter [Paenibacillus puldeungensis]|uniref:MMPL family transporter n=1 Tax=Paenibacillus puldeungensis TaxID=696536 RepID=A0ABW3RSD3_9BACL
MEDFVKTVEEGVKKTELITIVLIIFILIVVFKSPAAPFIILMNVGLSFLVSRGIVLQLVDNMNFTISNFTNVFLVLVLFGIGTDYSMLLLMRFKEELHHGLDKNTAIINTYKTAGKTVVISSLTIFIGFTCLMLSQFKVYRSASAVAVGVAVLIVMLFTFLPAMMKLFGKYIFWSPLKTAGHSDSKAWEKVASLSTKRPYFALLFVLLVCGLSYFYTENLSYNNLKEVGSEYSSVTGFNVVTDHFSVGKALPVTIAIKNNQTMDNQNTLSTLDDITEAIKSVHGVKKVYSVTQPKGQRIEELYINDQTAAVNDGLNDATEGVDKVNDGLKDAIDEIQSKEVDTEKIDKLQKGAEDLTSNIDLIHTSVTKLKNGMGDASKASKDLSAGIETLDNSMAVFDTSVAELTNAYTALGKGYQQIGTGLGQLLEQTKSFQTAFGGVVAMQGKLEAEHPELAQDATFVTMKQTTIALNSKLQELVDGITTLKASISAANTSLEKANQGLAQAESGIKAMKDGTSKLKQGSSTMSSKLVEAADGQAKIADALGKLEEGSTQLADGQNQMIDGINSLPEELGQLTDGLSGARTGLSKISTGLVDARSYMEKLSESQTTATFFIPEDKIDSEDFVKSMDMYMSEDKNITKINVELSIDPYSEKAMNIVEDIHNTVSAKIKTSSLKDSEWGMYGTTQMNVDLKAMSEKDFRLSSIIMLTGILIVLFVVTRDFWMSVFVMVSLIGSYYIAMSISGLIFDHVLGKGALTWNVPFFAFIMIIALGVDYSIFLIMRHRENKHMSLTESIVQAAKSVGGIIFSAGIILSGTFAAMYPSGVLTLMQLSITVIVGILLLCLIFLPVFIPATISIKEKVIQRFGVNEEN